MSSSGPRREVAYRVFADEFNDATHTYAESDEERAPNYLVTPTGARVNRLFVVGVLTEVEEVSDDVVRARVVDPTGAFVIYAGQYQPEALAFFERAEPPAFVAVTGKARTFQPEGSDRVFTSIRPETVNEVDAETRDRWVLQTAEHTLERVAIFEKALSTSLDGRELEEALATAGVRPGIAAGIPRAIETYGTTTGYLASIQSMAIDAARLVADEIDAVERADLAPDEGGDATVDTSFAADLSLEPAAQGGEKTEETQASTVSDDRSETEPDEPDEEETVPAVEADAEEEGLDPEKADTELGVGSEEPASVEPTQEQATPGEDEQSPAEAEEMAETETEVKPEADAEATDEMYELSEAERQEVEEKYDVGFESGAEIGEPESTAGDLGGDEPTETETDTDDADVEPDIDDVETDVERDIDDVETEAEVGETAADTEAETAVGAQGPEAESDDIGEGQADVGADAAEATEPGEEGDKAEAIEADTPADEMDDGESAEESEAEPEPDPAQLSADELEDAVIETMKAEGGEDGIDRSVLVDELQAEYGATEDDIEEAIQDALLGGRCFESGEDRLKPI